jgi:biopolymer transport protein ExbD
MAEINVSSSSGNHKRKPKKLSTRVDLTPMVDLGFLLITFFIFTTSMSEPKSMKLRLPDDSSIKDSSQTADSKTLSIIMGDHDNVWVYHGLALAGIVKTNYGSGIRDIIRKKREAVGKNYGDPKELVILIKPTAKSSYNNVVNVLDEMIISEVTRYMLADPAKQELQQIAEQ